MTQTGAGGWQAKGRAQLLPSARIGGVWVLTLAIGTAAAVLVLVGLPRPPHTAFHLPWVALTAFWAVAILVPVKFPFRRQGITVNFQEVPLLVGLVFSTPGQLITTRLLAAAVAYVLFKRQPLYKIALNLADQWLGVVGAVYLYSLILHGSSPISHRGWLAAVCAAALVNLASASFVLGAVSIADHVPERAALRSMVLSNVVFTLVNSSLGILTICVLWVDPWGGFILVAITTMLGAGYRAHQQLRSRQWVLERIHDFTQAVDGHTDLVGVIGATLATIRQTMDAAGAMLTLRVGAGWTRYGIEADGKIFTDKTDDVDALEGHVIRTAAPLRIVRTTSPTELRRYGLDVRQVVDAICVPLSASDLEGALTVYNRQSPFESFQAADVRALTSMGAHAGVALRSAILLDRLQREVAEKEYQALHDALTGLPNRTMFATRVEEFIADRNAGVPTDSAAVMLLDLDAFKEVNDTLGHQVGDTVLKVTAMRLLAEVGRRGTVARLGGDEFAVLIPATDDDGALRSAEAVKRAVELPIEQDELLIEVRVSIGVAVAPLHGDDVATLLRLADVAMYAAKGSRAGVNLYEARHDHYSPRRLRIAGELRQAMATRQLTIAYQPQLDLQTGRVASVEALVRWSHPRHGMVPPDEFIPVAEQTGLIVPLTDYVLTEALAQQARWTRQGYDFVVAVNLSPRVVQDGNLPRLVADRLSESGVRPDRLTLELTETGLATDYGRVALILHQLASMGVRTSIDDFGTGYSSLSRLSDLPVAEVKIDKSFIFAMSGGGGETLVRSIIDLGHNLKLRVVAEGVEDVATMDRLAALRCHAAQGYYLSKPLSALMLEAWMAQRNIEAERSAVIVPMRRPRAAPGF